MLIEQINALWYLICSRDDARLIWTQYA